MSSYSIKRKEEETFEDYHVRLFEDIEIHELDSEEIAKLLNDEFGSNYSESKWRKDYSQYRKWKEYILSKEYTEDETIDKLTLKKLELQKERNKLSQEKSELNKWIREQAKNENIQEKVVESIKKLKPIKIPEVVIKEKNEEKTALIDIADAHFGLECKIIGLHDEVLAEYSVEIFKKRMRKLLEETFKVIEEHKLTHVTVLNLSDSIDGLLHMNQLNFQQLGSVDQVMQFSEYMSEWLNALSKVVTVDYRSNLGNHGENRNLSSQRGEFPKENMERLITWYIEARLKDNDRVNVFEAKNLVYFDLLGTKILATHGQYERKLEDSIKSYMMIYDVKINQLRLGHYHHQNQKTIGMDGIRNIEYVQVPSICGINEYSLNLKKTANAGTFITVYEKDYGVRCVYPINFK